MTSSPESFVTRSYLPKTDSAGPMAEMKKSAPRMPCDQKKSSRSWATSQFLANVVPKTVRQRLLTLPTYESYTTGKRSAYSCSHSGSHFRMDRPATRDNKP